MLPLDEFFTELDRGWTHASVADIPTPIELRIVGSTALMLQTSYQRGTTDSDVLEIRAWPRPVAARLTALAGVTSSLSERHRLHLQFVNEAVLFLPQVPVWHAISRDGVALTNIALRVLDVTDVLVSKLARFAAKDLEDSEAMVRIGRLDHDRLLERFRLAVDMFAYDARADDLPRYVDNLHRVERDLLGRVESDIALPSWI